MQLICISRGSYSRGKELAERLAKKLDYECFSREELLEEAAKRGIAVGKMEMAMIKPHTFVDRFALEKEHYIALAQVILCEKALKGNLIYHGRTGHLLFHDVDNILRIRVIADFESRVNLVMRRLGLDRNKATKYIKQIEEDRRRWSRIFYDITWDDTFLYDFVINTNHLSVDNASTALVSLTELPEFKSTPASKKKLSNLLLAARCRLKLFDDDEVHTHPVSLQANDGVVSVTCSPRDAIASNKIPGILKKVPGVREILCTKAQTNILWVEENFENKDEILDEVIQVASKWEAAVELIKLIPAADDESETHFDSGVYIYEEGLSETDKPKSKKEYDGGIEDDVEEEARASNEDMKVLYNKLIAIGHSGGCHEVKGSHRSILHSMGRGLDYSLIIVGNLFLSKSPAARNRLTNETVSFLEEQQKVPVVLASELKQQYLFGSKQLLQLISFALTVVLIYIAVFANQLSILKFITIKGAWKILAVIFILVIVPLVSYLWGTTTRLFLKLQKFE